MTRVKTWKVYDTNDNGQDQVIIYQNKTTSCIGDFALLEDHWVEI